MSVGYATAANRYLFVAIIPDAPAERLYLSSVLVRLFVCSRFLGQHSDSVPTRCIASLLISHQPIILINLALIGIDCATQYVILGDGSAKR